MKKVVPFVAILIPLCVLAFGGWYWYVHKVGALHPSGVVASQERQLLLIGVLLAAAVVIPVYGLAIWTVRRYRATNNQPDYEPEWDHSWKIEVARWGIFSGVIAILAVVCWISTHALDPYKPLEAAIKPMTIQVVALQWKWLFIYPEQGMATVNFVEFPANRPIEFDLTADAPMNSFWIPQLGGQMYAMTGMVNKLNLMADHVGDFDGQEAEINGKGYAGMRFTARAVTSDEFTQWAASVKQASKALTLDSYNQLAKPSEDMPVTLYSSEDARLYGTIVTKYMRPSASPTPQSSTGGMSSMPDMPGM